MKRLALAVFFAPILIGSTIVHPVNSPWPATTQHVSTAAALIAAATTDYPQGIWRDDYASGIGAPPVLYKPGDSACSLNAGVGDGGWQLPSADGKCWLAVLSRENDIREWGADPTASRDSSVAFNACLSAVSPGGICYAGGHNYLLSGNVTIPSATTVDCGGLFDAENNSSNSFATYPALKLYSSKTIEAGGPNAAVRHCLIYPSGMSFPVPDPSVYSGIALNDNGYSNFTVTDTIIVGFDTCIYSTGARPYLMHDYVDCNGVHHPAIYLDTGNTDSGYAWFLKLQPLGSWWGTGSPCTALQRQGTGFATGPGKGSNGSGPSVYIGDIVSQNFLGANFDFESYAVAGGTLWADTINGNVPNPNCNWGSSIGVKVGVNTRLIANNVIINGGLVGLQLLGNGGTTEINHLSISNTGGDGLQLGDANNSGNLLAGTLEIAQNGGHAVDVLHVNPELVVSQKMWVGAGNGRTSGPPYITASGAGSGGGATTIYNVGPSCGFQINYLEVDYNNVSTSPFDPRYFNAPTTCNNNGARQSWVHP